MERFRVRLYRPEGVGTWTLAEIPPAVARRAGLKVRVRVAGTVDGAPFRSTVLSAGGPAVFVVVPKPIRERIGKSAGDEVEVALAPAARAPPVRVPKELRAALAAEPGAAAFFDALAPSHRKAYATWVDGAVQPATRARRVTETIRRLKAGLRPA